MPVVLRKFGQESIRVLRQLDKGYFKAIDSNFKTVLEPDLKAIVQRMADELTPASDGIIDWSVWSKRKAGYLRNLKTTIENNYTQLGVKSGSFLKQFYFTHRRMVEKLLKDLYPAKFIRIEQGKITEEIFYIEEAPQPKIDIVLGQGSLNQQFKSRLKGMLDTGTEPGMLIKTLSADHVKQLQREFVKQMSVGDGLFVTRENIVNKMSGVVSDISLRNKMSADTMRILRTSYNQATNADITDFALENENLFTKKIRMADGRPCIACIMLDGKEYAIAAPMNDHPNGMCQFVLQAKTLEELGFDKQKIPSKYKQKWGHYSRSVPLMHSRFWRLPKSEQVKVFGNQKLYVLWQKEQFPLERLATVRGNFTVPLTHKQAIERLPELGGVSYPLARFGPKAKALNTVIDPTDRADKSLMIVKNKPAGKVTNKYGLDAYDMNVDMSKLPDVVVNDVKKYLSYSDNPSNMQWFDFNQRARILDLDIRKTVKGELYYVKRKGRN